MECDGAPASLMVIHPSTLGLTPPQTVLPRSNRAVVTSLELDPTVLESLPRGCEIVSVTTVTHVPRLQAVRVLVRRPDGTEAGLFMKWASGANGASMMNGAFEAETAVHAYVPNLVPRPIARGTYAGDPDTHFYMCEWVDMQDQLPSPAAWASAVSSLHLQSQGKSPTGQFGFHVTTHLAFVPINNTWNTSWEAFWAQQMESLFEQEEEANGPDETVTRLRAAYFERAIPRFLQPLESNGRSVVPCLVHSDLWPGNIKPRTATGGLCMFDSCAFWGHNEADLAVCRNPRYKLNKLCIEAYQHFIPPSEPKDDFDGRNAVYAMKCHVLLSIMYADRKEFREILIQELSILMQMLDSEVSRAEAGRRL